LEHVYFAAPRSSELELLKEEGATHLLISFADRPLEKILDRSLEMGFEIMIDSGAYSAFSVGQRIDIDEYVELLKRYPQCIYINLDVCSDPDETQRNQGYLEDKGLNPIPVYHFGEPREVLEGLVAKGYGYIGLGNSILSVRRPQSQFRSWVFDCCNQYPEVKFHGFAVGALKPELMGLYSADSTTWGMAARYQAQVGRNFTLQGAEAGLFWTREELLRHNIRALLWMKDNIAKSNSTQTIPLIP
jgi:hypothetical protein